MRRIPVRSGAATVVFALLVTFTPSPLPAAQTVLPEVAVHVRDRATGAPAAGVTVELLALAKGDREQLLASAVTGGDGRAALPAATVTKPRHLAFRVSWSEPGRPPRALLYQVRVKKGEKTAGGRRFEPGKVRVAHLIEGEPGGDCSNLFRLEAQGDGLRLEVERPATYLDCAQPEFRFPDLAATGERAINQGKLNLFSFDEDVRLGRDFFEETSRAPEQPLLDDPLTASYVQGLVDRLGRASDMPGLEFHVRVIDADVLNAFALPGGYLFVYRGLIEATETEAELVGVLAHEIAHVTSRHGTEGMTSAIAKVTAALVIGGLIAEEVTDDEATRELIQAVVLGGTQFWIVGGTRKREAEADHLGAQYAWRAGYDPRGLATFFAKLAQEREGRSTRLDRLFSDHPDDAARVRNVSEAVDYFLPPREGLVVSSADYLAVKARLAELPPPQVAGEVAADALFATFQAANEELLLGEILAHLGEGAGEE